MLSNNKNIIQNKFKINKSNNLINNYEFNTKDFTSETGTSETGASETDTSEEDDNLHINNIKITQQLSSNKDINNLLISNIKYNNIKYYAKELNKNNYPEKNNKLNIILYNLVENDQNPFLLFLLHKIKNNDLLTLPRFNIEDTKTIKHNINKIIKYFENELGNDDFSPNIIYNGFIEYNDEIYVLLNYNTNTNNLKIEHNKYNSKWWWTLSSELVNYKKLLNFSIDENVTDFFMNNTKFLFLYDKNNIQYESPIVGYYGGYYKQISAVVSLGLKREKPYAFFGPYYYFGDYKQAMRYSIWNSLKQPMEVNNKLITIDEEGKYERGGLVRFALFTGKMKIMMNNKEDPDDDSEISIKGAKESEFIKATMKLRDNNGKWTKDYNSIGYGKQDIYLKNKDEIITLNPMVALKDYEQQVPIGYYYVKTDQKITINSTQNAIIE
jgi:hypothetical protein